MGDLAEMAVEDGGEYATVDLDDDLDRHLGALPHADLDALPPEGVAAATPGGSAEQPWAGIPYVSTKAGLDPTRLRLVAMLLRLGFDQTQVENLGGMPGTDDLGARVQRMWEHVVAHPKRDTLVHDGKRWSVTIFPPLSGRTTKREVKVAWDSGADPPTWSTRDAALREQRKADAARYREERTADRKRRQDGGAPEPPAPAAAAAPAPLTDKERDTFEEAVAWPEHAPLLLPFLNDSIRADADLMWAAVAYGPYWDIDDHGDIHDRILQYVAPGLLRDRDFVARCIRAGADPVESLYIGEYFLRSDDAEVTLLCLQAHVDYGDSPEHVVGDGNTDSPLWANAAFVVSAIGILGPEDIVQHMAPGLVANADVLAAIRRGRVQPGVKFVVCA